MQRRKDTVSVTGDRCIAKRARSLHAVIEAVFFKIGQTSADIAAPCADRLGKLTFGKLLGIFAKILHTLLLADAGYRKRERS